MSGGKASAFDNALLQLIFNAVSIANLAENASSSPLTSLYVSLHTADPGTGGSQTTSEAAYGGYSRVAVARTSSGWTVSGSTVTPAATIVFPSATSGSETETYFAVGTASSGAGMILYRGPLSPGINVISGVAPEISTTSTITEA